MYVTRFYGNLGVEIVKNNTFCIIQAIKKMKGKSLRFNDVGSYRLHNSINFLKYHLRGFCR